MDARTKKLIEALAQKRLAHGYSLRQLSSVIGVSFSSLARMERGEGEPDNNSRIRILEWLGDDAQALGLSFEQVALVHFRASKNIDSQTVHCLLQIADTLKRQYESKHPTKKHTPKKHESPLPDASVIALSKSEMEAMAETLRKELHLKNHQPLDPLQVAIEGVKVRTISQIPDIPPKIKMHLEGAGSKTWSAMSVPLDEDNDKWVIVRNEKHDVARQRVSLFEEYWHILLGHKLTKVAKIADAYGRTFDENEEHDAFYLAAATLLPGSVIRNAINEKTEAVQLAKRYGASPELVEYRIKRLGLWREYKGKKVELKQL